MLTPGRFGGLAALATLALGAWTLSATFRYEATLEPPKPITATPRGVTGRRLAWRSVEVPARPPVSEAVAAQGSALYAKLCAECHGPQGRGDGAAARAFSPPPRNFTVGDFRLKSTPSDSLPAPEDLYRTISTGFLATRMPAYAWLSPDDRWALVAQVIELARVENPDFDDSAPEGEDNWKSRSRYALTPPKPPCDFGEAPAPDEKSLERGYAIFIREGCVKCHGPEGRGDGPSSDEVRDGAGNIIAPQDFARLLTHSKAGADREDIHRVVTTGLMSMPSFPQLSEGDRWDVAAWVRSRAVPEEPETAAGRREVAAGRRLFWRHCAGCHGSEGRGDGPALPFLTVEPRDLTSGVYKYKSTPVGELPTDEDIHRVIERGVPGTGMPSWALLPFPERESLVTYLKTLAPRFRARGRVPRTPAAVPFAPRDLETRVLQGGELYAKWGCRSCHGAGGRGDGPLAPILQDLWGYPVKPRDLAAAPLHGGEHPEDTFRVLTVGVEGTPMPPFGAVTTEAERWALVAFVRDLRKQETSR